MTARGTRWSGSVAAVSAPDPDPDPTTAAVLEHPRVIRFRAAWTEGGGTGRIVALPESVHTAALAAQALGCEVGAIVKSLLFAVDGAPVLILTSGSHQVDVAAVSERIGRGRLRRADADLVRTATGQVIGGVSPLGHPSPIPTYLDVALRAYPVVWAAAGHPATVYSTDVEELLRMTGATEISVD